MFKKVLIANRGEIAVRIARTLREMAIPSVAVFSDIDRDGLHLRMADEAYAFGGNNNFLDYLNITKIVKIAKEANADAIHPGYGFLSENAEFAKACSNAGIVFIGPSAEHINIMGSKTHARTRMKQAGLNLVPGSDVESDEALIKTAENIGYPVMIKAASGGGGKGMRLVQHKRDLASELVRARSEAKRSFGDDRVYLEKAILQAKHIEIQVLGDAHGNAIHLFERDCSIQRRHQKVIEESLSPYNDLHPEVIERMRSAARSAVQDLGYLGAGTLEFLLDPNENDFFFLEMNTRLQVEHPVTELITGVDLVKQQLKVAAHEALELTQDQLTATGHAIECRIYAEDPESNFMPSPGKLELLTFPSGPGVRLDAGYYQGSSVPDCYDPMIAKLSCWAATRSEAIARMKRALYETQITGIRHNLSFLRKTMDHPEFVEGKYTTAFIPNHLTELNNAAHDPNEESTLAAAAAYRQWQLDPGKEAQKLQAVPISPWRRAMNHGNL
ncbi:MAG: acetyl-CoA carboxylase biotin carboxylase subunit [Myxococcales bacterium]|nr:MAG: acetyl-CoA carboxylase biotin carboxylase subunit [Myxococcales bacterium]